MRERAILLSAFFVVACKSPEYQNGVIACAGEGQEIGDCPTGLTCADDGFCYDSSSGPADSGGSIDASPPDAAPGDLQPGVVMFFDRATCPDGWGAYNLLEGRTIVGLNPGGAAGASVGTALESGGRVLMTEVPAHSHTVTFTPFSPPAVAHTHTVGSRGNNGGGPASDGFVEVQDIGADNSIPSDGDSNHTHTLDVQPFNSAAPAGSVSSIDVTMPYLELLPCQKQ